MTVRGETGRARQLGKRAEVAACLLLLCEHASSEPSNQGRDEENERGGRHGAAVHTRGTREARDRGSKPPVQTRKKNSNLTNNNRSLLR